MPEEYIDTAAYSILLNYNKRERAIILSNINDNSLFSKINYKIKLLRMKLILGWVKVG